MKLHQAPPECGGKLARCSGKVTHAQTPLRQCRQHPSGLSPALRASPKPQLQSAVMVAAQATRGQSTYVLSNGTGSHASELSPEAAKEGMNWLAAWVSSQYMGMGKSAEDAMPELRRRGVACSKTSNGQVLFRVAGQEADLDGPEVIKLLKLKARPGVQLLDPPPPPGLVPPVRSPARSPPRSSSTPRDQSPRSASPSREYQVGRLPDSPDAAAMRWLSEWIAAHYTGLGKQVEDVLPELRRRGVVYSSIKDGKLMFRVPGVLSRVEASQIIYMLRLQPRPGVRPEDPEPPASLVSMLSGNRMEDPSPPPSRGAMSPPGSRGNSPNRYSSPSRTRASSSLSPEAAMLGMRWLSIFVSSQYTGMGRSAEDALPELKAQGVVCTSVKDGRPMFKVPGGDAEVDAQEVVKMLRLELRPGVRPRVPSPPAALRTGRPDSAATAPPAQPAEPVPTSTVEDGIKWLASWVATNYSGMGKTTQDVLPELRRRGVVCSSVRGSTPMFRMPGQKAEVDGVQVIRALRLQTRPGVDPLKPAPPPGLVLGTSGFKTPSASAKAAATATAKRPPSKSLYPPKTNGSPATPAGQAGKAAPAAEAKAAAPEPPKPAGTPDSENIFANLGIVLLPAAATLIAAATIGGGSLLLDRLKTSGLFPKPQDPAQQRMMQPGLFVQPNNAGPVPPGLTPEATQPGSFKIGSAAPSTAVKPSDYPSPQGTVVSRPPSPPPPPPPPKIGQQNQTVTPQDLEREARQRVLQEQEQRRVEEEERQRQQRAREQQEQERIEREQRALAQQQKEQQLREERAKQEQLRLERERKEAEQREREQREREQRSKEQAEREQKEREARELKEREQREKEQREKEQREREQKEKEAKEQRVREQKEREAREREQKEREATEQREREQREREQREREAREQREREQREREQKEREAREQREREQKEKEAREQREREQKEREAREQREREQKEKEAREQREREQREREQKRKRKEEEAREQREREEQEQKEREKREQELRERELRVREQKERELREREEREKAQKEEEQIEREKREKERMQQEQMEREQREQEREQREQERRERERQEQQQRELEKIEQQQLQQMRELEQREQERRERMRQEQMQRAQEQREREGAVALPPTQAQGLFPQPRPSGVQPRPEALQQSSSGGVLPQPKGGVMPRQEGPYIDPGRPPGVQPLRSQTEQAPPAPQGDVLPPNQPKGLLPESEAPKGDGAAGNEGRVQKIGQQVKAGELTGRPLTLEENKAKQVTQEQNQDKWGTRQKFQQVEEGTGAREEDLAQSIPSISSPTSRGVLQSGGQVEGYEACIYRSVGC